MFQHCPLCSFWSCRIARVSAILALLHHTSCRPVSCWWLCPLWWELHWSSVPPGKESPESFCICREERETGEGREGGKVGRGEWKENNGEKKGGQMDVVEWKEDVGQRKRREKKEKGQDGDKDEGRRMDRGEKDDRQWAERNKMDGATEWRKTRQMDGRGGGREGEKDRGKLDQTIWPQWTWAQKLTVI